MTDLTLDAISHEALAEYGWIRRPSGRYVHPDKALPGARRRVFTLEEAIDETARTMQDRCEECGTVHGDPLEPWENTHA